MRGCRLPISACRLDVPATVLVHVKVEVMVAEEGGRATRADVADRALGQIIGGQRDKFHIQLASPPKTVKAGDRNHAASSPDRSCSLRIFSYEHRSACSRNCENQDSLPRQG